jgi:hypothetical protein
MRAFIAGGVDSSVEVEFFRYIAAWTRYDHLQKLLQDRKLPAKALICKRGDLYDYSDYESSYSLCQSLTACLALALANATTCSCSSR